ncbi:translation termination factor GTPase eRF3 [Massospora cicadina]|nr:translation termination factor GTPase eRF3 [Massospora cicadina]
MSGPLSKDDTPEQVAEKLKALNTNAPSFVPNANAKEFVPSWLSKPAPPKPTSSVPAKSVSVGTTSTAASPSVDKGSSDKTGAEPKPALAPKASNDTKQKSSQAASKPPAASAASTAPTNEAVLEDIEVDDEITEEFLNEVYKEHINVIFLGHVGMVDKRTMEKYEREAKEAGRESWYLSWALDLNSEERAKGITVECGRAYFETKTRRYTILDAPGHKNYVPSMLGGASQADVGVLVISARRGEFETGFERGGQTREHAVLAKTAGVNKLFIVINKMDDPTVNWDKER